MMEAFEVEGVIALATAYGDGLGLTAGEVPSIR